MVKRHFKKDKRIFWIFAILLVAIFSATAFLFLNPKKVYAESGTNNQETLTEIDYNAYTDSDFLINDNEKTIFDYPEMFAQKSKIEVDDLSGDLEIKEDGDDEIIQIVPRILFTQVCEVLNIGKEYGFYINTSNKGDYLFSVVLVFDISLNFDLLETVDNVIIQVKPVFEYNYIYLTADKTSFQYKQDYVDYEVEYEISENIIMAAPSYALKRNTDGKFHLEYNNSDTYYLKDVSMGVGLFNEQELNYGDNNYNPYADKGSYLTSYEYVFKGKKFENGKLLNLDQNYIDFVLEKLDSIDKFVGWLGYLPEIGFFFDIGSVLLQAPELIYSWFIDVETNFSADEVLKSVALVDETTGRINVNSYYQNRDDQLANYADEDGNPVLIKAGTIPFDAAVDGGIWHGVNDYATGYFRVNHSALNESAWYTRLVSDITLKVMNKNGEMQMFGTNTRHTNLREPVFKQIELEEAQNINLLPNGKNYFSFNAQFESEYEIVVPNSSSVVAKLDGNVLNFVNDKVKVKLTSGNHNFEIENLSDENKVFSSLTINPHTISASSLSTEINITNGANYLLKVTLLSQVKNLNTNNAGVLINGIYTNKNLNVYSQHGVVAPSSFVSHPFLLGDYYLVLNNGSGQTANINFGITEPETINLTEQKNVGMNGVNYVYVKFVPTESKTFVITAQDMQNLQFNLVNNNETLTNAGGTYYSGYFYEVGFDAGNTYYIGVKNNTNNTNALTINKTDIAYKWQISNQTNQVVTSAENYELKRNQTYTINLLINDVLAANVIFGYDNQSTAFGTYNIVTNQNQITLNANTAIYGNGVIVTARILNGEEYYNVDTLKIIPIFNDTMSITNVVNDEDITFSYTASNFITKFEYKLLPYSNVFTYDIGVNNAVQNTTNSGTISILNTIKSLNNLTGENLTLQLTKFYYVNAFNQENYFDVMQTWQTPINNLFAGGLGTEQSPFTISCKRHFNNMQNRNYYFTLLNNISFSGSTGVSNFTGTLNGAGFTIVFTTELTGQAGNFGMVKVNNGTIKNIKVYSNSYAEDENGEWAYVGGICGTNYGLITGCETSGSIQTYRNLTHNGGIAGVNRGKIENCTNNLLIQTIGDIGGIAGANYDNGVITNCVNVSQQLYQVTDTSKSVGGIVGYQNSGTVTNCVNKGVITIGGNTSNSKSLAPGISQITGTLESGSVNSNTCNGMVDNYTLRVITWKEWIFITKTHDQAKYVNFTGEIGKNNT